MRRITIWIDCKEDDVDKITEKLKTFLQGLDADYTIYHANVDIVADDRSK